MSFSKKIKCKCGLDVYQIGLGDYDIYLFEDKFHEIEHTEEKCLAIQMKSFENNFKKAVVNDIFELKNEIARIKGVLRLD